MFNSYVDLPEGSGRAFAMFDYSAHEHLEPKYGGNGKKHDVATSGNQIPMIITLL